MACVNTHSSKVQGAGTCCRSYPGGPPTIGKRWATTDTKGHCIVCEIKPSRSTKHPGRPVIGRGKGGALCPTTSEGCCAIAAAA